MPNAITNTDNLQRLLTPKNETEESLDLYFYGDIVSDWWGAWTQEDQYPTSVKNFMERANGRKINVHINSGGGSVFGGMAIYNLLRNYEGEVVTYVDGQAASIASVIALAGDRIVMRTGSVMMIHKPLYQVRGAYNADGFRRLADDLDEIQKAIMQVYKVNKHPDADAEDIEDKVNKQTWMTAEKAAACFDRIEVENIEAIAVASSDYIAQFVQECPPQFAQGKLNDENKNIRAQRAREIEIMEMEEIK